MAQQQPRRDRQFGNAQSGMRSGGEREEQEYAERWRDEFGRAAAMDPAAPYAYYGSAVEGGAYGAPPPPPPPAGMTTATDYGAATGTGLYPNTAAAAAAAYGTGGVGAGSQWGSHATAAAVTGAGNRTNRDDIDLNRDSRDQK